jgi:hypothetical protein
LRQESARVKKARHDGAAGDAEVFGDFVVGKFLDLAQGEDRPMFRRQRIDRAFEARLAFTLLEFLPRIALATRSPPESRSAASPASDMKGMKRLNQRFRPRR